MSGYPLGSDRFGRDLLSRVLWGARVSIAVASVAAAVAFLAGGATGLLAGFYGGVIDQVLMRLIDILRDPLRHLELSTPVHRAA